MEMMIRLLPGIPAPVKKSALNSFADSYFVDSISMVDPPPRFVVLHFRTYDGSSDPNNHIAHYRQSMLMTTVPRGAREVSFCKFFGNSLTRLALEWYFNLPNASISSFAQLADPFLQHFACSRKPEKQSEVYTNRQKKGESLKGYISRFNKEKITIPNCNQDTAVTAFRKGLLSGSDLSIDLVKYKPRTMEEVLSKAFAQARWEDDKQCKRTDRRDSERSNKTEGRTAD